MSTKLQFYSAFAERTARQITGSYRSWTAFLATAARLYKYPYNEQLMIYAQRPNATACAEYDFWKDRMGRYVQRGSTGIALIDTSGYRPRLRYVFDVTDTAPRDAARSFTLWEMRAEHEAAVSSMLEETYDIPQDGGIIAQFERVADKLALEYWSEQKRDICDIVADSFLNGYDEDNIRMAFKTAASTSITYALMTRCGFSPDGYFEPEDFMPVFDFNTPAAVSILGTAVSEISQRVLRQIEITVKRHERERRAERTEEHGEQPDLQDQRRISDPRPEPAREPAEPAARQIRTDAPDVSPGASPDSLESDDPDGNAVSAPAGDRRSGEPEVGADDAGADEIGRSDGGNESQRPIDVGGTDEHLQGAGRGSDPRGADLRITEPVQGEQISFMPEAENVQTSSASLVLDYNSIKEMHPDDIVLYQVGDFFEMYGEDARQAASLLNMNLTTRNIPGAGRVEMCGLPSHNLEMYVEKLRDKYDVTITEAPDFWGERRVYTMRSIDHEAETAIDAYEAEFGADGTRVFRDPAAEQPPWPTVGDHLERFRPLVITAVSEDIAYRNACGHSDRENAEIECNAAVRRAILGSKDMELIRLFSDMPEFRSRLHQEVFEGTYERLHDLLRPLSQDDIDDALRAWNGNIGSKHAVVQYMQQHGREKETAAWLAHEYGGNENNNLFIVRAGSPETAELTWSQVQRRLAQLIREDQFFTAQEKDVPENNPNYQLLDRLRADCEYFLGAGNRVEKHLWAGSVYAQIVKMRELYDALPQKPEWLTEEAIDDYADRMAPPYQVVTYRRLENGFDEKRDYQALEEAEKAAQGYVDGTMESNGFAYDGAAVYDLREDRYLSIVGDYPDEKAQAQAAGREQTEKPETSMNRAKNLISDFCQREYGSDADFSDPAKISVAYTTITDDEIPIQVNIDLVNFRLERYLDNEHLETRQYGSLQDLIANELDDLDFSDLIHISDEDAVQHRLHKPTKETEKAPKTVESASVHQEVSEQEVHETTSAQRFTATSYDDVFSIFDNLQHDVYVNDDRDVETFPSVEEAQAFADELNTKTKQAIHDLVGQRVEIDGVLYNVDAIDGHLSDDLAYLSAVPTADTDAEPKRTIDVVGYIRVLLDEQGRELAPNVSAYQALRAEHPEKLIGVRVGERLLFYGTDAERAASALHRRLLQRDISGMGETAVTGYDFGQWNSAAKRLLEHGHSFVFAQPDETGNYEIFNEGDAKDYIPIGMELEIDGRKFVIDSVNFAADEVSLQDVTFQSHIGYPIFRTEHIAFVRSFVEEQQKPLSYTIQPVEVIPAEQNHLPYDVVIQTLRTEPLEPVVSDPEPAETESPAMSEEEALILEHEGRAALSEMGEFVPDVNDAISQVEIDEPSAHRPVVSIPIDGEWTGFPSVAAAEQAAYADFKAASHRNAQNFHITDDALGVGGAKAKYQANINAIRLLKHLEAEGLQASAEQQQVLSRYVGWGGLADAFDESKDNWKDEFAELYATLSPEEYAAARASTLNAHYTSPTVINAIYEAVGNMGFQTGNILEPSMGVGNFFGCLPEQMQDSKLYGVELDSITGRIAKQLYPQANITVAGFETTDRRDFYDLAIGNVPFGQYQVNDRAYNKLGFSIHNYFFAKALDQVRPCGIVAFVTSRYTMDSKDDRARRYIAERADLLGAIRLPNNAFKANAGTDVVSDILFLQKRDRPLEIEPEWTKVGENADGFAINKYFIDHPEMILGRQSSDSTQYGKQDFTVEPIKGLELADQLHDAVKYIRGTYQEAALPELGEGEQIDTSIPADPDVKNYSYTVVHGEVYYRENSVMVKPDLNATAKERVKGMIGLRDCVQKLIAQQMDSFISDETIRQTQRDLNRLYDAFTAKYGLINSRANNLAFSDDSSYYLLCSLEILNENRELERKADIFTKRTIKPHEVVTTVDTASEALALSISEKACVDMEYMAQLSGKSQEDLIDELNGVIFLDPVLGNWQTADEYLSGNVRRKLQEAEKAAVDSPGYLPNVEALRQAQPKDLDASEIEVRLGATWIDYSYIQQFMEQTFKPPYNKKHLMQVRYSPTTAEWNISGKSLPSMQDVNAYMTYGTERANAYRILEDTLNLRDVRIYDTTYENGVEKRVLNQKETTLAQQKQQAIKDAFQDWIWKDPTRRQTLVKQYNEKFNSLRPREYDGSHIRFSGMNPEITLREHQKNAIAHILYGGNTLLAHEVGAGKTFEMVAAEMESKRLGLCQKAMFVVPNHLTEQWASEFLRLYPSANILVTTKKDFETRNRKKFCARIATGDYDAVIIGHSQFEKIPISKERQERLLHEQIYEIEDGIRELQAANAEHFTIKSLERTKKGLLARLEKLHETERKDDVVTFEQLGIDRLYVDEAHSYKNLFLYTKMRNVAGLSTTDAQKSSDMLLKCRYIDEITGGKGVVFATGTPVSNSMTELFTMMRYLQHDTLRERDLTHFDCWASTFGETTTAIELAPEGTGYRARTRFAKFFNLPELMNLFKEAADIKTADQLHLPTPTPVYHTEVSQPTQVQQGMVQELSKRAAEVHSGKVNAAKDNMLKITSDGRKLGLDQRIINPNLPDDPCSKVNRCVDNIFRIWQEGQADKLAQLVFCDLSTPKASPAKAKGKTLDSPELRALETQLSKDGMEPDAPFSVYDDIRGKLVTMGIPREQIAFIHEANTEVRKKELFSKVRSGQVRVLMGSTFKMGAGMNVQDRLIALHDLDCPWRPGDLEQRSGRIIRQGNRNKEVHIYRYVTEGTFDAYLWQTIENKQRFISQIMTSKSPVRSCEDIDETALSYAEIKALCAGDERIKEKMDLDVDVARLKLMRSNHQSQQYRLEDNLLRKFPEQIDAAKNMIAGLETDIQTLAAHPHPEDGFAGMEVKGDNLTDKDNAGAALLETCKEVKDLEPVPVGSYRGFQMALTLENFGRDYILTLKGQMSYRVELGRDARGNLVRIDNALNAMPERVTSQKAYLDNLYAQVKEAKAALGKPFPQEEELRVKSARLAELNAELNIDDKTPMERLAGDSDAVAKSTRPSILQKLRAPLPEQSSPKPKHKEMEVQL